MHVWQSIQLLELQSCKLFLKVCKTVNIKEHSLQKQAKSYVCIFMAYMAWWLSG